MIRTKDGILVAALWHKNHYKASNDDRSHDIGALSPCHIHYIGTPCTRYPRPNFCFESLLELDGYPRLYFRPWDIIGFWKMRMYECQSQRFGNIVFTLLGIPDPPRRALRDHTDPAARCVIFTNSRLHQRRPRGDPLQAKLFSSLALSLPTKAIM